MNERFFLSSRTQMGAILTEARACRGSVVISNSGVVHRIGANRVSVLLARALSDVGLDAIRFDMRGIGTSALLPVQEHWTDASVADIHEIVDHVRTMPVALFGNCGGAAKSFWAALSDERVGGLLLTNPPPPGTDGGPSPSARSIARGFDELAARGVRSHLIFASADPGLSFYVERVRPLLATAEAVTLKVIGGSNHTFAPLVARDALITESCRWAAAWSRDERLE